MLEKKLFVKNFRNWKNKIAKKLPPTYIKIVASFIAFLGIVHMMIIPIFPFFSPIGKQLAANSNIDKTNFSSSAIYENNNPDFKIQFGNKNTPDIPVIKFEAKPSQYSGFIQAKPASLFDNIGDALSGDDKKGIEMKLVSAGYDSTNMEDVIFESIKKQIPPELTDIVKNNIKKIVEQNNNIKSSTQLVKEESESKKDMIVNPQVIPNTDLKYQVIEGQGLKEDIVINRSDNYGQECLASLYNADGNISCDLPKNRYVYEINFDNDVKLHVTNKELGGEPQGTFFFTDSRDRYLFHIPLPYAEDAAGKKTNAVDMNIEKVNDKKYKIYVTVNLGWLLSQDRTYPIKIDPSIVHNTQSTFNQGTFNRTRALSNNAVINQYNRMAADKYTMGLWYLSGNSSETDQSGNGNNLSLSGSSVSQGTNQLYGNVTQFTSNGSLYAAASSTLNVKNQITVEAWINPATLNAQPILEFGDASHTGFHVWQYNSVDGKGDSLWVNVYDSGNTGFSYPAATGRNTVKINTWTHIAATYDGSMIYIYINGVMAGASNIGAVDLSKATQYQMNIGNRPQGGPLYYVGFMSDVRVSNIARTGNEIKADASRRPSGSYNSPVVDFTNTPKSLDSLNWTPNGVRTSDPETAYSSTNLGAQWNFNNTSGTTATSGGSCGSTCNGTLTNFASTGSQDAAINTGWTSANRKWGAGSLMFDGVNDFVSVPSNSAINPSTALTIEGWFKPVETFDINQNYNQGILDKGDYQMFLNKADGKAKFVARDNTTYAYTGLGTGMGNGDVKTITEWNGALYVGGTFTTAGGVTVNNIAKWDGSTWSALGVGTNNSVYMITIWNNNLYAAGVFTTAGGVTVNGIAKWNGASWSALSTGVSVGTVNVQQIAVWNNALYAGGYFTGMGTCTTNCNYIAKWDGTTWSALSTGASGTVYVISPWNGALYVGGGFSTIGGVSAGNIAKWDGSTFSALGTGVNSIALAIGSWNGALYLGGIFTTAGGVTVNGIAKWDGSSWSALGTGLTPSQFVSGISECFGYLCVGGGFTTAGGGSANYIAKWNGSAWSALGSGVGSAVVPVTMWNGALYIGGGFTTAGGNSINRITRYGSTNTLAVSSTTSSWSSDKWYHYACVYDGSTLNLYVNGILEGSVSTTFTFASTGFPLLIGKNYGNQVFNDGSDQFYGFMDSTRIYTRGLLSNEVASNYAAGNIEFLTRSGSTSTPDSTDFADGTNWDRWKPYSGETQINSFDNQYLYGTTDSGLVSYFPMDETANPTSLTDVVGSNNASFTGGGAVVIEPGKFGNGRILNTGYYTHSLNGFGSSTSFTIELWMNPKWSWNDSTVHGIWQNNNSSTANVANWVAVTKGSGNGLRFDVYSPSGTQYACATSVPELVSNTWTHIAATYSTTGVYLYINGKLHCSNTGSFTTPQINTLDTTARLGYSLSAANTDGAFDEVRLYNTQLSAATILQHASEGSDYANTIQETTDSNIKVEGTRSEKIIAGSTVVDTPNTILLHMDETGGTGAYIKDATPNARDGTPSGTTSVPGILGRARSFSGTNDNISFGTGPGITSTGNFTYEAWIYTKSYNDNAYIIDRTTATTPLASLKYLGNKYYFQVRYDDGTGLGGAVGGRVQINKWTHIAMVREYNASFRLYVDGALVGSYADSGSKALTPPTIKLGCHATTGFGLNGYMDEFKVSNIARSDSEIFEDFNLGQNHKVVTSINSTDLTTNYKIPFWIAADKPGSYMEASVGESQFANYENDANTLNFYHLDEPTNLFTDKFAGTTIDTEKWVEVDPNNKISQNTTLNYTTNTSAWDSALISTRTLNITRNYTSLYAKVNVGASQGNMFVGFGQDQTSNASYIYLVHGLYFGSGGFYVYENGTCYSTCAALASYSINTTYEVVIYVNSGGTAQYMIRGGAWTVWTALLNADTAQTNTVLRPQTCQYNFVGSLSEMTASQGTTIKDSSPYKNDGNTMGTNSMPGRMGNARYYSWRNEDITNIPFNNYPTTMTAVTVDFWAAPAINTVQYNYFLVATTDDLTNRFNIHFPWTDGNIYWDFGNANTGVGRLSTPMDPTWQWEWAHWAFVVENGNTMKIYRNGNLIALKTGSTNSFTPSGKFLHIGSNWGGSLDEFRISSVARTQDEIRQAYEYGLRTHPITVDYSASPSSNGVITSNSVLTFNVSENNTDPNFHYLFQGDKMIIKENYNGVEYIAQGTVSTYTNSGSTGTVTLSSWDAASTFPPSGYSTGASVFKWQREYFDTSNILSSQKNATTRFTLKITSGGDGRFIWIDDLENVTNYLNDSAAVGNIANTPKRYFQYKAIYNNTDTYVSPYLTNVTINYTDVTTDDLMRHGKYFNNGVLQPYWWAR